MTLAAPAADEAAPPVSSPRLHRLEAAAVVATGALHLLFESVLRAKPLFMAVAGVAWVAWLGWRLRRDPVLLRRMGLSRGGLRPAAAQTAVLGTLAAVGMAAFAVWQGTLRVDLGLALLFLLYPIWGLLQQLLLQGLLVRNLVLGVPWLRSPWRVTPVAALLFGTVHAPDGPLMLATFTLALAFVPLWLRWRNLWPLGLWHGWLGAMAYVWMLGRDPWAVFREALH